MSARTPGGDMADEPKTDFVTSEELAAALSDEAGKSAPYLIVLAGPGAGRTYRIDREETIIGRGDPTPTSRLR